MTITGNVSIRRQETDFISADGFEAITGYEGLFIRQTAAGTEVAFCDTFDTSTIVLIQ